MPKTHKAHIDKYGRQSENIEDLRDRAVGPKGNKVKTKAAIKAGTIGKLASNYFGSEDPRQTNKTSVNKQYTTPPTRTAQRADPYRNLSPKPMMEDDKVDFINRRAQKWRREVGTTPSQMRKEAYPAQSFVKDKKPFKFLKHKIVDN